MLRSLKRATALLAALALLQLLLINNTDPLECDPAEGSKISTAPVQHGVSWGTRTSPPGGLDTEEIVQRFMRIVEKHAPAMASCSQVTRNNASYPASLLAVGSLELTSSDNLHDLSRAIEALPGSVDLALSTLVDPLYWTKSPTVSQTLSLLKSRGLEMVSLATENMHSTGEEGVKSTTEALDEAGIHWTGLALKKDDIITLNGLKVGVLSFCAVYRECSDSDGLPFMPVRYSSKVAASGVKSLISRGADVIVVLVRWGRKGSYYPDETALVTARYLASLGVSLIVGSHSLLQQDHAYFEDTLVIFSAGSFSRTSSQPQLCWQQTSDGGGDGMEYSTSNTHCSLVQPSLRSSLLLSEQHTSLYRIQLSRSSPAVAEYASLPLTHQASGYHLPEATADLKWTRVCGEIDTHCLACDGM